MSLPLQPAKFLSAVSPFWPESCALPAPLGSRGDLPELKGETGVDRYQVRQCSGWYLHISLSVRARVFLTVIRPKGRGAHPAGAETTRSAPSTGATMPAVTLHKLDRYRWQDTADFATDSHCRAVGESRSAFVELVVSRPAWRTPV